MKIGLLGSFFNPPHLGHVLAVRQVLDYTDIEKVWFLPGNKSSLCKETISIYHRLNMANLIKVPQTEVSTLEIDYDLSGNTIELVPILKQQYPKDDFVFIIGSDWLPTFHKWGDYKKLLTQMKFLIVPRAGYPLEPLYDGMTVLKHKNLIISNISSSMIKERIKNNLSIEGFVMPEIKNYIEKNRLYNK
jgi:nicotinate-nucleotide adenylyltransferase